MPEGLTQVKLTLPTLTPGDTTAYGTSWLMKEIHCSANKHFDPLGRIHAELLQQNIQGFLTYGEAPVSRLSPTIEMALTEIAFPSIRN